MPKILHNVREGILMVARDLLTQSGYASLSVREVAGRCGIGVGTLYHYYPSKQELVAAIIRSEWDVCMRCMAQHARSPHDSRSKIEAIYGELCLFLRGAHDVWAVDAADTMQSAEFQAVRAQRALVRELLAGIVRSALSQEQAAAEPWLAECVSRLLLSYAGSPEDGGNAVSLALEKLLQ